MLTARYTEDRAASGDWPDPLELNALVAAVGDRRGADGAVVTFLGLVRNHNAGRRVRYLEYEAFEPLALKAFEPHRTRSCRSAGRALASRCTIASAGSRSARPASRSRRPRRIAPRRTPRAGTRSSASSRSRRSGSASSSRAATCGLKARPPTRTTRGRGPRRSGWHARDGAAVRPAARHRRRRRAGARGRAGRDDSERVAAARRRISRSSGRTSGRFRPPSTPTTRGWIRCCATATKSRSCRRYREDNDRRGTREAQRSKDSALPTVTLTLSAV